MEIHGRHRARAVSKALANAALVALAALVAIAALALSSCSIGDSEAEDGSAAGEYNYREGDDGGGGGGGGIGGDGNGGNGGGGGGDGGGAQGLEAEGSDGYTQPTYTKETQEQIAQFQELADDLSMEDASSATSLFQAFRSLAFVGQPNDGLFFAYESAMQSIGDSMNEGIDESGMPDDSYINNAIENGFMFVNEEGNPHFTLRPDFLCDTFYDYVSGAVKDLLALRKKHYEFGGGHEFLENDTIMVTLDQLAEMIVDWEGYLKARRNIYDADAIQYNLDFYLKVYVGSYQIENSGFYVDIGTDIEGRQTLKLADEPRQSYLMFIENFQNSGYWPIISELFQVYQANDFLYTIDIEAFFERHGLTVPV